jgi:thiosulfate dehydrogenase
MASTDFNKEKALLSTIQKLINLVLVLILALAAIIVAIVSGKFIKHEKSNTEATESRQTGMTTSTSAAPKAPDYWVPPSEAEMGGDKDHLLYGKDLIVNTAKYFGPKGIVKAGMTNGMNCQNCHLEAGTKPFGNNYGSVAATYPRYRARSGTEEDIYKRITDCFERSLNGKAPDRDSREMQAMADYINWLGRNVPKGQKADGAGLKPPPFLERAADPALGELVYAVKCASCHQPDGKGSINIDGTAYVYPPLWGPNSYNDGAGLYRLSNFAAYVKTNMPLGATHKSPMVSDEEAWDLAAFVNSQPRPSKDKSKDWPKIEEKPFDHPFGPFPDGFSEAQHKYGPFGPIKAEADKRKNN